MNSTKHASSSPGSTDQRSKARMPGVSTTKPPKSSGSSSASDVVCRPFSFSSLTSRVSRFEAGLEGVDERALADAALARRGPSCGPSAPCAQLVEADAGDGAGAEAAVAEVAEFLDHVADRQAGLPLVVVLGDRSGAEQVHLVEAQHRAELRP